MTYNVKISCEDLSKVINFTIDNSCLSTDTLSMIFNSVVKENYNATVSLGCKKHRGKAVDFPHAILIAKSLRFFKHEDVPKIEETKDKILVMYFSLPNCTIESNDVSWGTFFNIQMTPDAGFACVDYANLKSYFENHGLDWHVASNGYIYTHNHITFKKVIHAKYGNVWRVSKIETHKKIVNERKMVML